MTGAMLVLRLDARTTRELHRAPRGRFAALELRGQTARVLIVASLRGALDVLHACGTHPAPAR